MAIPNIDNTLPIYDLEFDENQMVGVYGVSLVENPAINVDFLKFSKTEIITCNCSTTDDDIDPEITDLILSKGEKIDSEQWELLDESRVNDESDTNISLSSVVSQSAGDGIEDNEIFKVRYEYTPSATSATSRDFCIKMASSGLTFKKEDLVNSGANPGLGAKGANRYNVLLYKGGVNCQHYFTRKIYFNKNNKKMSVFEALKEIGKLSKSDAKKAKLEVNPSEVSQVASAENNYWRLSSEELKFSASNKEKRILTSPVLIPEQLIYRDLKGEKCYVKASADTIEQLQQNFFKNQYQKNSTIEHDDDQVIDGVYFFESWIIKDSKNDKANALGFNDLPAGTWMISMKVENDEIWNDYVSSGKVKGFSIDSRLGINKVSKKNNQKMNYSKVKEAVMAKILLESQLSEYKIDDSLTVMAESLEKDMVVFDNDNQPLMNVVFVFENKNYKTDENGVIIEISDVEVKEVEAADEAAVDAPDVEQMKADLEIANTKIVDLESENATLQAELISIKNENVDLKAEAIKLSETAKVEGVNLNDTEINKDKAEPKSTLSVIKDMIKNQK